MSQAASINSIPESISSQAEAEWRRHPPAVVMGAVLKLMGTDLANEREVINTLVATRAFNGKQVVALMDEAIAIARS